MNVHPIGIFDSGIGGLTVLKQLVERLPAEEMIYLGDTARLPYGDKSPEAIVRFSVENARFLSIREIKMLVIACNTASAYAVDPLRAYYSFPVIDVIDPAVSLAVRTTATRRIAVLGTRATIQSGVYPRKILEQLSGAEVVSVACPLFVPLVEENFISHPAAPLIVEEYLSPLRGKRVDTVILGCTHYPLLMKEIETALGPSVQIIDSASVCAQRVAEELDRLHLKNRSLSLGRVHYYASDSLEKFQKLAQHLIGIELDAVGLYEIGSAACV